MSPMPRSSASIYYDVGGAVETGCSFCCFFLGVCSQDKACSPTPDKYSIRSHDSGFFFILLFFSMSQEEMRRVLEEKLACRAIDACQSLR